MRILVADTFPEASRAELHQRGHDCSYEPDITAEDLPKGIRGYDALVVRSTKVTADALAAANRLQLVIRAGSGTNTIDTTAASRHGISVCNVPGRNAVAVAELAVGLLLAVDRRIPDNVAQLRAGEWNKKEFQRARGVKGRRIGIVGLGDIGLAFAERVAAFGTSVHAVAKRGRDTATLERARAIGVTYVDTLETLVATCDVLSLHVPGGESTRGLVGRGLLGLMWPGTILINTSRGDVIDEAALLEAMDAKGIRVGLDVFPDEPTTATAHFDSPLTRHPNVYGTHHIGASTEQAQQSVADGVLEIVDAFTAGTLLHCVNRDLNPASLGADGS
ncbi:hypothetical protein J4H86_16240 [Spiractinospora alimapuensis]|uniref:NAD(P)-dependent oxidoreductase n=1 Tax=Spiractinospora alimapuensis TaxID=2820884 RepID=UPI001F181AC6|nr:NAD(P)-dependent oxidoreductase [Spiractinospora alimapuensis]QVQ50464.1 hypothetical protein J4H86_16240 [Spiractinospora alimapuensis]